jgi:hypothetical protein
MSFKGKGADPPLEPPTAVRLEGVPPPNGGNSGGTAPQRR